MQIIGIGRWFVVGCCLTIGCGGEESPAREACPTSDALEGDGESIASLSIGRSGSCAVADDGTLLCWGDTSRAPEPVPEIDGVIAVDVGVGSMCAVRPGGGVVCWSRYSEPQSVPGLCNAVAVNASMQCAVAGDGSVRCWGGLNESVFGKSSSERAIAVPGVTDAIAVAAGPMGYECALIADGSVTCWGGGPRLGDRPGIEPQAVPEISDAVALSGSEYGSPDMCAVLADGGVTCWTHALAPAPLASIEDVVTFAHDASHSCAVFGDGAVRCWGRNTSGQLGNGTNDDSETPVLVEGLTGAIDIDVSSLDSTIGRSCALLDDGGVRCWGSNAGGALGNDSSGDSNTPVEVAFP